jgi:hypothetical protein
LSDGFQGIITEGANGLHRKGEELVLVLMWFFSAFVAAAPAVRAVMST